MHINQIIPAISWLKTYEKKDIKGDVFAGLTVGVMLIPQGMAYAMIAGMPPIYGLYASSIPLFIYAIFGSSRHLAVGPVAMVSLMIASGVGLLAEPGSESFISMAILLALMVGVMQFMMGALRLGFLVKFLSHPVISGFTSAAALIIGLSQLKHLLGIDIPRSHHVHEIILHAFRGLNEINIYTLTIGVGGIVMIILFKRLHKAIPAQLAVVVLGILAVVLFGLSDKGVKIIGTIPEGLPAFSLPNWSWSTIGDLYVIALAIALVSFMESIAVAKAIQSKHQNYTVDPNTELVALGLSNIVGSFFQSFVVTGGFSRSAVNDQAGANTGLASVISAILIIITLLFLTPLFYFLPKAILASIIMLAVFGLIDYKEVIYLWKANKTDFWMLILTFLATLTLGIEQGIGVGVVLSLAMVVFRVSKPYIAELGRIPGTHFYRNIQRFSNLETMKDVLILRFDAQLFFANVQFFREEIYRRARNKGETLELIILNAESVNNMDSSAIHMLYELTTEFKRKGIKLYVTGVHGPVRDAMQKGGLLTHLGEAHFYLSVQEAIDSYNQKNNGVMNPELKKYGLQTTT